MHNKYLLEYSDAIMSIPAVRYTDQLMGIWFDIYVDLWLKMYYAPAFIVGKEDELKMASFGLINLLSSRMSSKDFTYCASALMRMSGVYDYSSYPRMPTFMYMSGTPLNEAVIAAMEIVPEFQKRNRLQIVNTVFLTDGEGSNNYQIVNTSGYGQHDRFTHMVIRDPKTGHEETVDSNGSASQMTNAYMNLMKQRTQSNVVGFYILFGREFAQNAKRRWFPGISDYALDEMKVSFRKSKYHIITNSGYDEYYILRSSGLNTEEDDELVVSEKTTTRGYVSAFSKYAGNKVNNRVILNRFINLIT